MSRKRWVVPAMGVLVALTGVLASSRAQAVSSADWNPGLVISDPVFYDSTAMTAAQIQTLFDTQGANCQDGAVPCLRNYKIDTPTMPADSYCTQAYSGAVGETAAVVIAKVSVACGINPQVLIATMQKETSLVTSTAPSQSLYNEAMGYGCPDSSVCDPTYAAFFNQVYQAARQFQIYRAKPAGTYSFYSGGTFNIQYSPVASCGSAPVTIQNWATASLYIYTPYQPNAAALANMYGTGDPCSSYGNRNFWTIFNGWFGASVLSVSLGDVSITGTAQTGAVLTAQPQGLTPSSASVAYQWLRGGVAIDGATSSTYQLVAADVGSYVSVRATGSSPGFLTATGASATVLAASGVMTGATPTISGTVAVGSTLTVVPGVWSPSGAALSYQWLRSGQPIAGATGSAYTLLATDADLPISVTVTAALPGYTSTSKTSATVSTVVPTPMFRLYNPNSGEHFYTASTSERDGLVNVGWRLEGVGWTAPSTSNAPVYRLYNPNAGDHFYTLSASERDGLVNVGWRYEGIGWYSETDTSIQVPLYRAYNPNAIAGSHNYTTSLAEQNNLVSLGWHDEGIAWYGMAT